MVDINAMSLLVAPFVRATPPNFTQTTFLFFFHLRNSSFAAIVRLVSYEDDFTQ